MLHRPVRQDLIALAELAALVCDVPMASINLLTASEQHMVAAVGFEAVICQREDSMCATTILLDEPVVVPDASLDVRFRDNPFVTGVLGEVRFYASHQLYTPDGIVIGTLCVFDRQPRHLTPEKLHALGSLAGRVVDALELTLTARRLIAANERLGASNERLGAFAGQISHDLKNPLSAIAMSLEMARDDITDVDMVSGLLERASRGADRMNSMIGDLLAFARGGAAPERREVDLAAVMDDVREDLSEALAGATITAEGLPTVSGDPVQLRVLLQNLIANALKFTRPVNQPVVTLSAERLDHSWRVSVADNGPGVPLEERERVFEPFTRVDKSVPGTGIGLSTCKRIVEAHRGRIGLAEASGGGALVWFELPD